MSSLNKAILIGNLGRDPEVRMTQGGQKIANLNVATTDRRTNKTTGQREENTEWHRLILFGQLAEVAEKYLRKGSKAYFEGRIQTRKWTDKDGAEKYTTEILVDSLTMLESKQESAPPAAPVSNDAPFDDSIPF